jgi:hypothetical protein
MGALIVIEALAGFVTPPSQASHRHRTIAALVAEVVGEPAERIHAGEVTTQRSR